VIELTDEMVTAAAEVAEDEMFRLLGRDLGTIHRNDIIRAILAAGLAASEHDCGSVRRFWFEPTGVRGETDGATVTVVGELAYMMRRTSRQGHGYMTGVLRAAEGDGEMPVEVPPAVYARVGGLLGEGGTRRVTARLDRRGPIHLLSVRDVTELESEAHDA
jgi:hypothetical protein